MDLVTNRFYDSFFTLSMVAKIKHSLKLIEKMANFSKSFPQSMDKGMSASFTLRGFFLQTTAFSRNKTKPAK
jgi:hypothetical protein